MHILAAASALRAVRAIRSRDAESNARVDLSRLGEVGSFTQESPLELAVFSESRKFHRKKSVARTMPKTLPACSIVRIDADLCMVCPELIVLQMASRLSEMTLAQLIMELCGTYSLSPVSEGDATGAKEVRTNDWDADAWDVSKRNADECAFDLEPVTNIEQIRWYSQHVLHKIDYGDKRIPMRVVKAVPLPSFVLFSKNGEVPYVSDVRDLPL